MRWIRGIVRTLVWTTTGVLLLLMGGLFFLTRTGPGIRFVVGEALERLEGGIHGTVAVEGVEAADLLEGALLLGLEIRDAEGRLFARADSLQLDYSVPSLLAGDVVLQEVDARGLTVIVERLPGQDSANASRIFAAGPPAPDTARSQLRPDRGRQILLRNVRISRGGVEVRLPVDDPAELPEGAFTLTAGEGGGLLRRYAVRDLEVDLPQLSVARPGQEGQTFRIARLSALAEVQREPVRLVGLRVDARLTEGRLAADLGRLSLQESQARGAFSLDWGGEGMVLDMDLQADPLALSDLRWILPDLPDARVRGGVGMRMRPDTTLLRMDRADIEMEGSLVRASGTARTSPDLGFQGVRLEMSPLVLGSLDPWFDAPLPFRGPVRGTLRMDGAADALSLEGEVTLREPDAEPTLAHFSGTVEVGEQRGARDFRLDVDPLDYALVKRFLPGREVTGSGSLLLEADGRLEEGMQVMMDLEHEAPGLARSRIEAAGTLRLDSVDLHVELAGELDPVDLRALRGLAPTADLRGQIEGPVRLTGRVGDLRVETELQTAQGRLAADGRFDARDPAAGYQIDLDAEEFRLSDLFGVLPAPTVVSGSVVAEGRGFSQEAMEARARVRVREGTMARFVVGPAHTEVHVQGGSIRVDTLEATTNVARLTGSGSIGLATGSPEGRFNLSFRNDSLATMRPLVLGDGVIAADTLSPLEREVLVLGGVDPDTLPTEASIALDGRLQGSVVLEGRLDAFSAVGSLSVREVVYGSDFLRGADLDFSAAGLPSVDGRITATLQADSVRWFGRSFAGADLDLEYERPGGRAVLNIRRSDAEDYRARASFETEGGEGVVHLDELVLRFAPVLWNLGGPATFEWGAGGLRVMDFRLIRPGVDGMRIFADGILPSAGPADFDLEVRGLSLGRVAALAQTEEAISGVVDLDLHVGGTAASPIASGAVRADSLLFRNVTLSRVEGTVEYGEERLTGAVRAWRDDLLAARIEGSFPLDLGLRDVEERVLDEELDLRIVVDSFPVAILATVFEAVDDVRGSVSGEVRFAGSPSELLPSGSFRLQDGSFRLPALGIQPTDMAGTVELLDRDRARVDLQGRSGGEVRVRGFLTLDPVINPTFGLTIDAQGFQAVNRRDLQGRGSGRLTLTGTYERPVIAGQARVDEGVLRIEEFERSAEVVDLSDPRFFDVVDTSFVSAEPGLQQARNPFLQNLQVEVDLQVQRSSLRSREMNVEMGGDLTINWNRTTGDLVLTGQLSAIRGTYSSFGRQFQVSQGSVEFVGTPGLNPNLGIQAITRLRTVQGEPLTISATVGGTLTEPRVTLSSDAQPPIAESDLVSYLIFGRPSFTLGSGETAVLQGAATQLVGATATLGLGTLASQLGTVVGEVGVDYFAVTQAPGSAAGSAAGLGSTVAATQVEAGWYLEEDVFVSLLLRPLVGVGAAGASSQDRLAGVRVEWQLGDVWTVQGFWEDRFSREQISGFGDLGYRLSKILGFFLYRDWGY